MSAVSLFINGQWKPALEGGTREILNPAIRYAMEEMTEVKSLILSTHPKWRNRR